MSILFTTCRRNAGRAAAFLLAAFFTVLSPFPASALAADFPSAYDGAAHGPGVEAAEETGAEPESIQTEEVGLGGSELLLFSCSDPKLQCLSCLIRVPEGDLIVVDGGLGEDAPKLKEAILERGGVVSAWLLTHPHGDHAGALYRILEENRERRERGEAPAVGIGSILCSLHDAEWYAANDPNDAEMALCMLDALSALPDAGTVHRTARGERIEAGSALIEVMNDPYEADYDKGNNACVVYRVTLGEKSVLFLGDLALEGGKQLLKERGSDLKSDIVQVAHHGQNGVDFSVYEAISPQIALWPTPEWLWNSWESRYTIRETKEWMRQLKVRNIGTMNGDILLR